MPKESDSLLGDVIEKMTIYKSGFDISGEILLCKKGLVIKHNGDVAKVPFAYVKYLDAMDKMALGRVRANINVFDQTNGNMDFVFEISDMHFNKLAQVCKKQ